jgi:hypothetical protein
MSTIDNMDKKLKMATMIVGIVTLATISVLLVKGRMATNSGE